MGYLRPVTQWNDGKQEEFKERKLFDKNGMEKQGCLEKEQTVANPVVVLTDRDL